MTNCVQLHRRSIHMGQAYFFGRHFGWYVVALIEWRPGPEPLFVTWRPTKKGAWRVVQRLRGHGYEVQRDYDGWLITT